MSVVLFVGCNVNVGGRQRPLVRHEGIQGEVELVAEGRTDEQSTSGNKRDSETTVFEERLRLKTDGDIYHPDLLFYNAVLGIGLAQQRLDSDEESDRHGESLNDYSVFAELLRGKWYPTTVYATKSEEMISRQFLGALRTERQNRGATLSLRSEDWPMTFQYTRSESDQDELTALATDFFSRDDERFRYTVRHSFSDLSRMSFDFDRTEVSQRSPGAFIETDTDRYTALHDLIFGSDEQHRLDSFFNFVDQSGTFNFENLQVEERLKLQHLDSLLTNYKFRFADYERETIRNKETRGEAGFEHRLYESLVTTANVFTSETDLETQGDLSQRGGTVALNYRKNNRWGLLLSTYTAGLTKSEQSGGTGTGVVINESHTATELIPVELDRVNIDVSSIQVKNDVGLLFQEGEDYTITERNGRVWLNIITVGGAVPPNFTEGQEFFVDYNFFIEPERQEDTLRQNITVRERFDNGFSVYYAHRRQDEDVSSTVTEITPDEYTINAVGADYSNKGLFLQAEYSEEDSTQVPSTSKKLHGRYSWPVNRDTNASVRILNHWLDFGAPDERDVMLFKTGTEIFSRLTDKYGVSARADYRDEDDTRFGTTRGFQFSSELQYHVRQLSIVTGVEFNTLNRRNDDIDGSFLYVRLKRFF
ncbi:MAG: hypothetical protein JSW66_19485 [Phycisphaerales bacterium]|nr:MAG: hypothetical protein JSW66_19485 [Phycisphaerales bacterium]